jgi:hypothetical protein
MNSWIFLVRELSARMGLRRRIQLRQTECPVMPLTWGAWRPVLLLPSNAAQWSWERRSSLEGRLRAILDGRRSRAVLSRAAVVAAVVALTTIVVPVAMLQAEAKTGIASNPARPVSNKAESNDKPAVPAVERRFVRMVVGLGELTFEGQSITWEQLPELLKKVPDRSHTVLELAVASDNFTMGQINELTHRARILSGEHGFEHLSFVGVHPLGSKPTVTNSASLPPTAQASPAQPMAGRDWESLLNDDQRQVLDWTDRQFRSFFDARTFDGWSEKERAELETRLLDTLKGPQTAEYYRAINSLGTLRSKKAVPALLAIANDRAEKNCRDRWMAIRALGIIGDTSVVPELIHLVYHGNINTRWWAQMALVRLTRQNFGKDWKAWGNWWNSQNGSPPFQAVFVRWYQDPQWSDPDKLDATLAENDRKFFESLKP